MSAQREMLAAENVRALGFVPLLHRGELLGELMIFSDRPRAYSKRDLQLAATIGAQVTEAVARARLLGSERSAREYAERAQRRTALLAEASALLSSSLEWKSTIAEVAKLAVIEFADRCVVEIADESGQLQRIASLDRAGSREETAAQPDGPLGVECLSSGRSVLRAASDGRGSVLIVPMGARGRVLGVLTHLRNGGEGYAEEDRALAELIGRRAGIAIDNALLYEEARQAIAAREQVLAVVSHDLRNPLSAIILSASSIQSAAAREEGNKTGRQAEIILRSANRMSRLIEDLLDFSSIERGKLQIGLEQQDISAILLEVLDAHAPAAVERGVELTARDEVEPALSTVLCDRARVLQVFDNLLSNALLVTPRGGAVRLGASLHGSKVRLTVTDTGPGIASSQVDQVFDRYWRGGEYKGRGLGLAISKGIVEAHGGRIWAESTVGQGATFCFELSLSDPP
jgi:signal transduction histidine kinase